MPMSCPKSTTSGSSERARESARLTACTSVSSAIAVSHRLVTLAGVGGRKLRIKMIEHRLRPLARGVEVAFDGGIDLLGDFKRQCPLLLVAPHAASLHEGAQAAQRTARAMPLDFLGIAVAGGIVGRVVVLHAIGDAFDEGRAAAGAG